MQVFNLYSQTQPAQNIHRKCHLKWLTSFPFFWAALFIAHQGFVFVKSEKWSHNTVSLIFYVLITENKVLMPFHSHKPAMCPAIKQLDSWNNSSEHHMILVLLRFWSFCKIPVEIKHFLMFSWPPVYCSFMTFHETRETPAALSLHTSL